MRDRAQWTYGLYLLQIQSIAYFLFPKSLTSSPKEGEKEEISLKKNYIHIIKGLKLQWKIIFFKVEINFTSKIRTFEVYEINFITPESYSVTKVNAF